MPFSRFIADRFAWACAFWLHLVLYAVLVDAASRPFPQPPPPAPLEVDLMPDAGARPGPEQGPPMRAPAGTNGTPTQPASPQGKIGRPPENAPVWVTATTFRAADVLKDPRSSQAREALASLTGADSREQICALEAMEQLRHDRPGFRPTRLAPHAFRNAVVRDGTVQVTAGAVRSDRIWYEIAYRCHLDAGRGAIASFEYALGAPVNRALWDEHGLAPIH